LIFYYKKKRISKLFENAFEILEKEKEIAIFFLLSFRPEGLLLPFPTFGPLLKLLARSASTRQPSKPSFPSPFSCAAHWVGLANQVAVRLAPLFPSLLTSGARM
jgi:hypothetical protein